MATISMLHLSDLHFDAANLSDRSVIFSSLFLDIEKARKKIGKIDFVFITGDLINKGAYTEENVTKLKSIFIEPLLRSANVDGNRLFITPGNHDLQHTDATRVIQPVFERLDSLEATNQLLDMADQTPYLWAALDRFNQLRSTLCLASPISVNSLYQCHRIAIEDIWVGIACVNSAWKSTGRTNDFDYGKLQIGQRQIDKVLSELGDASFNIALMHHPLNWCSISEQGIIERALQRNFAALLVGHNHKPDGSHIAGPSGNLLVSNAGCLYQKRDYFNGYSIIVFDTLTQQWTVNAREFYFERSEFDVSTRFATDGEIVFRRADIGRDALLEIPSAEYIGTVNEAINCQLLTSCISEVAPKDLQSIFVEPPMSHISERKISDENGGDEKIAYVKMDDLLSRGKSAIFVGEKESGKTTLLHYICSQCNLVLGDLPRFPVYVNLEKAKITRAGILDSICNFSKGAYRRTEFQSLLANGQMTICFDNLPAEDERAIFQIEKFILEYPNNRFFFSARESFRSSITNRIIPRLGLDCEIVYLHSFSRRHARALISKWFGEPTEVIGTRVDGLLKSLRRMNIPRTPFLISILLWVQEKNIPFNPVNQAEILDIFVDGILEKLQETKERGGHDSTIKRHFLSELAFTMHTRDTNRLTHHELEKLAVDYFERRALPSASGPLIGELKKKGVLVDLGDDICFKFDCLRAFFLANKFKDTPSLLEFSLTPQGFLRLHEELDYFTGKQRDQIDVLRRALNLVDGFFKDAGIEIETRLFDEISMTESPITLERREAIERRIFDSRLPPEKHEELLDNMDAPSGAGLHVSPDESEGSRRAPPGRPTDDFVAALRTASAILRNSELVDDAEVKHEAYARLNRHWCHLLMGILASVELFDDEELQISASESIPDLPRELRYMLKLLVPNAIFGLAFESIGTAKLEVILRKKTDQGEQDDTISHTLSTFLYVDLNLSDRLTVLQRLLDRKGATRFLVELVFFKLVQLFMFRKLSETEERQIKPMIGEVFARLSDAKDERTRARFKSSVIARLDRNRLLKELVSPEPST